MSKIKRFELNQNRSSRVFGLGLVTDEPVYRICWLLNNTFNWGLIRTVDLTVSDKSSPLPQSFICYENGPGQLPALRIIGNRSNEGLWLTIFRQVDFLLVLSEEDPDGSRLDELKTLIGTKIPQIRGLFKVPLPSFCYL